MKNRKRALKTEKSTPPEGSQGAGSSRVSLPAEGASEGPDDRKSRPAAPPRHRPHDFRRARPLTERQLRALEVLHGRFAGGLSAALSALVRTRVQVSLASVSQGRYFDFIQSLPSPTGLHLVHCYPQRAPLVLEINLCLLASMIERLLGGSGDVPTRPVRPLTRIEQSLAEGIAEKLLAVLSEAWGSQPELRLDLAETEHNPLLMQVVGPAEPTVVFTFEVNLGVRTGQIHLALPLEPFEPLLHRLARHTEPGGQSDGNTDRERERILTKVSGAELTLQAELPAVPIRLQDLLTLQPGDIIDTQISHRSEVALLLEGRALFRGQPATQEGRRVVRITRNEG